MGTGRKQKLHRKVAQAYSHCEETLSAIAWLHSEFEEVHPEHAVLLGLIAQNVLLTESALRDFATKTWGHFPTDYTTWLQ